MCKYTYIKEAMSFVVCVYNVTFQILLEKYRHVQNNTSVIINTHFYNKIGG